MKNLMMITILLSFQFCYDAERSNALDPGTSALRLMQYAVMGNSGSLSGSGSGTGTSTGTGTSSGTGTCSTASTETYSWGTFTEMCDGTIKFAGVAGTFGGNTYTAQTLYFSKCTYGQTYAGGVSCSGTAQTVKYCSNNDNSCDNYTILNGTGTSGAYSACSGMNSGSGTYGKTNWRVPTKNELKTLIHCTNKILPNDNSDCGTNNYSSPPINSLFPNTIAASYWSTSVSSPSFAWTIYFSSGSPGIAYGSDNKMNSYYVRCVSGP